MQSWTWTNSSRTRRWTDAKNWSPEGTPQDGDEVTIPAVDAWGNTGGNRPRGAPAHSLQKASPPGPSPCARPFTHTNTHRLRRDLLGYGTSPWPQSHGWCGG